MNLNFPNYHQNVQMIGGGKYYSINASTGKYLPPESHLQKNLEVENSQANKLIQYFHQSLTPSISLPDGMYRYIVRFFNDDHSRGFAFTMGEDKF